MTNRIVLIDEAAGIESVSMLVSEESGPALMARILSEQGTLPVSIVTCDAASADSAAVLVAFWPLSEKVEDLFRAAAAHQIPRLVVIDQVIEFSEMRLLPADRVACIGRAQARRLAVCGNLCEVVGVGALDRTLRVDRSSGGPGRKPRIIIWHSGHGAESESLHAWADAKCIKENFSVDLLCGGGDRALKKLAWADACLTTDSNRLLVSMIMGTPTALARYSACPEPVQPSWRISSMRAIDSVVREMLSPQPARLLFQDTSLHMSLEERTPAIPRLQFLVGEMVQSQRQATCGERRQFTGRTPPFAAGDPMVREERFRHEVLYAYPNWLSDDEAELKVLCERFVRFAKPYESQPLSPEAIHATMECCRSAFQVRPGGLLMMEASIANRSDVPLTSAGSYPVYASYHWRDESGRTVVHDGVRTPVHVPAGCDREVAIKVFAPGETGRYELVLTLVAEGRFWFDASPPNVKWTGWVTVSE